MKFESISALLAAYINCYAAIVDDPTDVPILLPPASEKQIDQTESRIYNKKIPPQYRQLLLISNGLKSNIVYHINSLEIIESYDREAEDDQIMRDVLDIAPFPHGVRLAQVIFLQGSVKDMAMAFIVADPESKSYGRIFQWKMGIWGNSASLTEFLENHIEIMCPQKQ